MNDDDLFAQLSLSKTTDRVEARIKQFSRGEGSDADAKGASNRTFFGKEKDARSVLRHRECGKRGNVVGGRRRGG